jgi:hypothetical protein
MTVNNEMKKICKEATVARFRVFPWHLLRRFEENQETVVRIVTIYLSITGVPVKI